MGVATLDPILRILFFRLVIVGGEELTLPNFVNTFRTKPVAVCQGLIQRCLPRVSEAAPSPGSLVL